jgi:NAD(P)-dependent dehydrogenase (short-subunit alcohol dehydrogenase family)
VGDGTAPDLSVGRLFDVTGRTAVVTGGSRGIGAMIAAGLVANGVDVWITARRAEACDRTAAELDARGPGRCRSVPADLSDPDGVTSFAARIADEAPQLDILVNNAGATWGAPLEEFPRDGFDKVLSVNLVAPFFLTQALLGLLRSGATADDPARVVMVGSIDGIRVPVMDSFPYSASKAGVHMLTRHLARALADDHVTVNAIAPGPFESRMMAFVLDDPDTRAAVERSVPRGRIGSPEDVAGTTLFLCSRAGAYLTGAVVPVDGGISTTA